MYKKVERVIPFGHPNRPGYKLENIKAIVVHCMGREKFDESVNASYMSRKYENGTYWNKVKGVAEQGAIEFNSKGKGEFGLGIPFVRGSVHVFCDVDSVILTVPLDEVTWNCGDRNIIPFTEDNNGQQRVAKKVFNSRQNYSTIAVGIYDNVIMSSDECWSKSVDNAVEWIVRFLRFKKLVPNFEFSLNPQDFDGDLGSGEILILRHYDITGRVCPKRFVDDFTEWSSFLKKIEVGLDVSFSKSEVEGKPEVVKRVLKSKKV